VCSSPRAFLRGNEGTRAASRKSRLTSRTLIYEAPDSPRNVHLRYNVGSIAVYAIAKTHSLTLSS